MEYQPGVMECQPGGFCGNSDDLFRMRTRFEILVTEFFQAKVMWSWGHDGSSAEADR